MAKTAVKLSADNDGFSPLPRHKIAAKLREMELTDDTGDQFDAGYMEAVREMQEWLALGAPDVD